MTISKSTLLVGTILASTILAGTILATCSSAWAGQAPGALSAADIPISHHDRVYAAEQFSNTVSVTDPADNKLIGVIRLGDTQPANLAPLYRGQLLVHGLGFSPDGRTLAVVSIASNSVTFIDTATNAVKHVTYVGRSPHESHPCAVRKGTRTHGAGRLAFRRVDLRPLAPHVRHVHRRA